MLIAHNTFTSRRPKQWWLWPVLFAARCQSRSYKELYEESFVDGYDVRIWFDKYGEVEFRHGMFAYDADDFHAFMKYCDERGLWVRLFLESRTKRMQKEATEKGYEERFIRLCRMSEAVYSNIHFYGGKNMLTWKTLYDFGNHPKEEEYISSTQSLVQGSPKWLSVLDDVWPWLYAKVWNGRNRKRMVDADTAYLFDFL